MATVRAASALSVAAALVHAVRIGEQEPSKAAASSFLETGTLGPVCDAAKVATSLIQTEIKSVQKAGQQVFYQPGQPRSWFYDTNYGGWENDTFNVFQRFAPGKVSLDIGAWVGPTALWLGKVSTKVVALEPTEAAFTELCKNLAANPDLAGKVTAVNAAMDSADRTADMSNKGDSSDRIQGSLIEVQTKSIVSLRKEYPELEQVGFVKIDTEGYERVIVPALESFFKEKKPTAYVSLHPQYNSKEQVQATVDKMKEIFPFLYEADMKTPFATNRANYTYGDHEGADVIGTWSQL
eukprot:TRINITY_DN1580_c0_g2_i1.p1 TRINITY_DN1580_c0_g2~~TRINITY_DN1580_c0_g2_i1.p1  ORF type:complete len:295 (-),score=102.26 TRINITY_DN1580_c0_g2_i1:199-1083(-)